MVPERKKPWIPGICAGTKLKKKVLAVCSGMELLLKKVSLICSGTEL